MSTNPINVIPCRGADALATETIKRLLGPNVAISGGSTFAGLFPKWAKAADLSSVSFFPADERRVPIDHADSNWGQARRLLFDPLGRPGDIENFSVSAPDYEKLLGKKIGVPIVFDTVFLGMGDDGHTVSLFPGTAALEDVESQVLHTSSPKPPTDRITLGLRTLWASRSLVAVITGENKRPMVQRLLQGDRTLPITLALYGHRAPILILEESANPT